MSQSAVIPKHVCLQVRHAGACHIYLRTSYAVGSG